MPGATASAARKASASAETAGRGRSWSEVRMGLQACRFGVRQKKAEMPSVAARYSIERASETKVV